MNKVYVIFFNSKTMKEIFGAYTTIEKAKIAYDKLILQGFGNSGIDSWLVIVETSLDFEE